MILDKQGNIKPNLIKYPQNDYNTLKKEVMSCARCHLRKGCTQVVMGEGNVDSKIMFIGEGPGADEDRLGRPFVGKAGKLLNRIFNAIEINREEVYITNIVKCRPPRNRKPTRGEIEACSPILAAEINMVDPKVIIPLGSVALRSLINEKASITKMRGRWQQLGKYYFLPTFHPAYLLRNEKMKKYAWYDFKIIKKAIERLKEIE